MTNTRRLFGGATATIAGCALASAAFVTSAAAVVSTPNAIEPTAGATQINLLGINDFHGRILTAELYAATLLTAQQGFGEANSLVFSNGDAVGASIFESSILNDQPTIDILNEIGVDAFTQGNHEFDKGADDASNRIAHATNGPDLAANVIAPDGTKPFAEYATFTVNGVDVAIVGAVTQETPGLVSPEGIAGYEFTDPVDAVNDVATRLSDGDDANGEADIIIASYHEGAPGSNVPLEQNLETPVFADMVNNTSPEVDAIFNAHSHRTYAYDAPVPGSDRTRPVVQAGEYGGNIAQVVLTLDTEGNVTLAESSIVPTLAADGVPAEVAADQRLANIRNIVAAAQAEADVLGAEVIGTQTGDISRAKSTAADGTVVEDDRANASSLGDVVATSMLESVAATGRAVDLAVMNPGGLRADLLDNDGQITYKEAATVLPFANNLSIATVTGATLKGILEEQWQRTADGEVPSRPYLQLGISDGFTYTYDSTRAEGDRITGMYLGATAIDPAATYNVVAPTFLTAGGDNFRSFNDSANIADTGLIDLDAFVSWVRAQTDASAEGVVPNQQRNSFEVQGLPTAAPIACGDSATFAVSNVDLGSLGAIVNTSLTATAQVVDENGVESTVEVGTATITDGAAELTVTIPGDFRTDTFEILLEAHDSGSHVILPIAVDCSETPPSGQVPGDKPAPSTPAPGGDDTGGGHDAGHEDGDLVTTGADANMLFGVVAAAFAALVLGGTLLLLLRRRSAK